MNKRFKFIPLPSSLRSRVYRNIFDRRRLTVILIVLFELDADLNAIDRYYLSER